MNKDYPQEGLYGLEAKDIYDEARKLYDDFFSDQTPINAFRLSITLYHLLEWVIPESNGKQVLKDIRGKKGTSTESDISREEQLVLDLRDYEYYKVLKSLANNSKHFALSRSSAYEKGIVTGLFADYSVAGERVGQKNLVVDFKDEEVWIRKVFYFVLTKYSEYFN